MHFSPNLKKNGETFQKFLCSPDSNLDRRKLHSERRSNGGQKWSFYTHHTSLEHPWPRASTLRSCFLNYEFPILFLFRLKPCHKTDRQSDPGQIWPFLCLQRSVRSVIFARWSDQRWWHPVGDLKVSWFQNVLLVCVFKSPQKTNEIFVRISALASLKSRKDFKR